MSFTDEATRWLGADIFAAVSDPLLLIRADGLIVDCNSAAVHFLELARPEDAAGRHIGEFSPLYQGDGLPSPTQALRMIQQALASGSHAFEWQHRIADGSLVFTDVMLTRLPDNGEPLLLVHWHDISGRRRQEAEIRQLNTTLEQRVRERTAALEAANRRLAEAAKLKDEFLATMSHELRTPLTGILSFAQTLEERIYGPLSPNQVQAVQMIYSAGNHLLLLINGILDLSHLQAQELQVDQDAVSVGSLCQLSLRQLEQAGANRSHRFSYAIDQPDLMIKVDTQRIVQMLEHLLNNAAKFTPPGGKIELRVGTDLEAKRLKISVLDNGIGIAAPDQERIFEPFVQLDARLGRRYGGVGIGLALVRAIAELHNGSAGVESIVGFGSCFWVELPLA